MRAVRAILGKELRELWRDPLSLTVALLLPVALLVLFAYGLNLDVRQVRLGLYDLDQSSSSRDYLASLAASGDHTIVGEATSVAELGEWLDQGRVDVGVIVPPSFQRTLLGGETAGVQLLVDGSDPIQAKAGLIQLDAAAAYYNARTIHETLAPPALSGPAVVPDARVWYNPELKSVNYIVPGLFSLILMTLSPLLSTLAIVRERERGSIQQVLVAPISPVAFIVGKAVPYGLLAYVEMLLVVALGLLWFRVPFRGSLPLLLLASVVYVLCTVGLGLLISTVTRSQVVAMLAAIVVTLMPAFLLSGFLFPVYSMPERYQWLSQVFPARHFTEIARGLALKGLGLDQLWPHLGALALFAVGVLVVTTLRFHRRMG